MLSFQVKIFTKDMVMVTMIIMIIMIKPGMLSFRVKMFTKDILMVMVLTVQGKWGHCPPTCNIINEGSSSQPESAPATVI